MGLTTNQKIAVWAQGKLGKKVSRGECWDLGEEALKQAGAKTSTDLGPVGEDSDYVWGDEIDIKDVQSGDIIQLRDHEMTTTTETTCVFADGSVDTDTEEATEERPHHTAIANGKLGADGVVKTMEQNIEPKDKVVQNKRLATRDAAGVVQKSTEKRMNPTTHKLETAKVTKKVTVTVTGTIWVYRPKPK